MVTLYTSDTCGICRMVKMKLEKKGIPYQNEKNVDALLEKGIQRLPVLQLEDGSMMENITDINSYFDEAIHKTHISLNEKGTKAAAVTYFGLKAATAMKDENKYIDIVFNRPFMYIIKDKDSNELLFMGTVYTPNKWHGNTCESEE